MLIVLTMEESHLLQAIRRQDLDVALNFIRSSACLDQQNSLGESALILITQNATVHMKESVARKIFDDLILYGADPNIMDTKGRTALMYATLSLSTTVCSNCDHSVLEALVLNGAKVDLMDSSDKNVFHLAHTAGDGRCYDILVKIMKGDYMLEHLKLGRAQTALNHVASCKNINARDEEGNTLLLLAVKNFSLSRQSSFSLLFKLCEKLVLYGADVNAQNKDGVTPLMMLVMKKIPCDVTKLLQLFFDDGANLLITDKEGRTVMIYALQNGYIANFSNKIVKWLLNNGADPLVKTEHRGALAFFITGVVDMDTCDSPSKLEVTCKDVNKLIASGEDDLLRFFLLNGALGTRSISVAEVTTKVAVADRFNDNMSSISSFLYALVKNRVDVAKYLFVNGFLTDIDIYIKPGHSLQGVLPPESAVLFRDIHSQPWPLVKLAFIAVSTSLGSFPERKVKIESVELPLSIKDSLNFKNCVALACKHQWHSIPIYIQDYDRMDAGRPYLSYWPLGQWYFENALPFPCKTCLVQKKVCRFEKDFDPNELKLNIYFK
ncbi:ankyrin repeat protein [Biomphalaria pfeifferi]|uniref:Ankyrin repeat protein n=1 Tax=Biomphalaria pfeifferi TaxID=112525 RepID=A0AAD8FK54_BIOPF|nr:ankyrin repeat protein [Biomphalaria pfeifferi]